MASETTERPIPTCALCGATSGQAVLESHGTSWHCRYSGSCSERAQTRQDEENAPDPSAPAAWEPSEAQLALKVGMRVEMDGFGEADVDRSPYQNERGDWYVGLIFPNGRHTYDPLRHVAPLLQEAEKTPAKRPDRTCGRCGWTGPWDQVAQVWNANGWEMICNDFAACRDRLQIENERLREREAERAEEWERLQAELAALRAQPPVAEPAPCGECERLLLVIKRFQVAQRELEHAQQEQRFWADQTRVWGGVWTEAQAALLGEGQPQELRQRAEEAERR